MVQAMSILVLSDFRDVLKRRRAVLHTLYFILDDNDAIFVVWLRRGQRRILPSSIVIKHTP